MRSEAPRDEIGQWPPHMQLPPQAQPPPEGAELRKPLDVDAAKTEIRRST